MKGKKRSLLMLGLSIPMFSASVLFCLQLVLGRRVNVDLAVIAGVSLLSIVCTACTVKQSPSGDLLKF